VRMKAQQRVHGSNLIKRCRYGCASLRPFGLHVDKRAEQRPRTPAHNRLHNMLH